MRRSVPQTTFDELITDKNDPGNVTFVTSGSDKTQWNITTGQTTQTIDSFDWFMGPGDKMYGRILCNTPEKISNDIIFHYGKNPSFSSIIDYTHKDTGERIRFDILCQATYRATATMSMKLDKDVMTLTGAAGTALSGSNTIRLNTDPGRVKLTVSNGNRSELRVSFAEDTEILQTELKPTTSGNISIPIYVTTLDTSPGKREYSVNIRATFI
ncbi:TPA: hypothetical protein ACP2MC_004924 [Escherichia coli]